MALFNINPSAIGTTLATTAGAKAAMAVAQRASPKLVQDVQRVLKVGNILGNVLGLQTGIGAIDSLFALNGGLHEAASPLLGGLSMKQAKAIHEQVRSARVAKKNLFFLRITDQNPPTLSYGNRGPVAAAGAGGLGGLFASKIGPALGDITKGINNAVQSAAGTVNGALNAAGLKGLVNIAGGEVSTNARPTFDLLALDVTYGASINSETAQIGSTFIDRPTGMAPSEVSVTTMDDEAGTIKRWFEAKQRQVAAPDGTFGLPVDYLVTIEVVHAVPSEDVEGYGLAYSKTFRLRPASKQIDLSRRDQAVSEIQLQFSQFDGFMGL